MGFTLIELLVVIFIISTISGSVLIGSWRSQDQYYATKAAQKLTADLRRVQNMALVGKLQGATSPEGYGIYVQSASQYLVFYNTDSSKVYGAASRILETVVLEKTDLSPIGANVFFTPPDPITHINGVANGSQVFTVTSGLASKETIAYASGRIDTGAMVSFLPAPTPTPTPAPTYEILASAGDGGSILPSGLVPVEQGADQSFAVDPDSGHLISSVTVDGEPQGKIDSYTFYDVQEEHAIVANFAVINRTAYSTPGAYQWVVPAGVTTITVKSWGGGGGGGGGGSRYASVGAGGNGAGGGYASADIAVTPGETLTIYVGGGGGQGNYSSSNRTGNEVGTGGGGGGYSGIARNEEKLLISAGGGGGGGGDNTGAAGGAGGGGGGVAGVNGVSSGTGSARGFGGGGGTISGGVAGAAIGTQGTSGLSLTGGHGGNTSGPPVGNMGVAGAGGTNGGGGGGQADSLVNGRSGGGGGGGGYFGGGGGGAPQGANSGGGGGGGGSAYTTGTNTMSVSGSGQSAGNKTDEDYIGNAGSGGDGGAKTRNGVAGQAGLVVIIYAEE